MGPRVYSIGHSNHPPEVFLDLLTRHVIEVLVDVRSHPYSRFASHFNREALRSAVRAAGIQYVFMGDSLGGRPQGDKFYDRDGHVLYGNVAEADWFSAGIERLCTGASSYRVAMMCTEEDPADCHRRLLVGRVLATRDVDLLHIRGDGCLVSEDELAGTEIGQPRLFAEPEGPRTETWRSTRSVSRASRQLSSSIS